MSLDEYLLSSLPLYFGMANEVFYNVNVLVELFPSHVELEVIASSLDPYNH